MIINLTIDDNGKTIQANLDDKIIITLMGKPTTGFIWRNGKTTAARLDKTTSRPVSNLFGAEAVVTFEFTVLGSGVIELDMNRHWEIKQSLNKWFLVRVILPDPSWWSWLINQFNWIVFWPSRIIRMRHFL